LDGETITECVIGHDPLVMNSREEIQPAFEISSLDAWAD